MQSRLKICLPAAAFALALYASGGFAQTASPSTGTDQDHSAHHPQTTSEAPAAPAKPNEAPSTNEQSGPGGMMGMMGQGGMMGQSGMMGQGGSGGMTGMNDMMSMMRNMMTMMSAQSGMMAANVEARIASLKSELKITDAQTSAWNKFADALRAAGGSMNDMYQQMMQSGVTAALPARLDRREMMLAAHLSRVKALKEALTPLYASLSDAQKEIADSIMIGPMGMM
jgi:predicted lipid-binding transport protein (Tim44 family)